MTFFPRSELKDLIFHVTEGGKIDERTPDIDPMQRDLIRVLKELVLYRIQFDDMEKILTERAQMRAQDLDDMLKKKIPRWPQ